MSSTYVSMQRTCPSSCAFKGSGCYAESGFVASIMQRVEASAPAQALRVSRNEAAAIDGLFGGDGVPQDGAVGGRDLRLHVGGDVSSDAGARALAVAAARWTVRGGGAVWTYTHKHASVGRASWGYISVLASVETVAGALAAMSRGYAAAITVDRFVRRKPYAIGDGLTLVPCPAEVGNKTCATCRLCMHGHERLARKQVIGFSLHGAGTAKASGALAKSRKHLPVIPWEGSPTLPGIG